MGKKRVITKTEDPTLKERGVKIDVPQKTVAKASPHLPERSEGREMNKVQRTPPSHASHGGVKEGRVYIFSSYNNTIMTLADAQGNVLSWVSAGSIGFKGTKKATPFAASKVAEAIADFCRKLGIEKLQVAVRGVGSGRESAVRSLAARGMDIASVKDVTPIPHNGCRPPKVRRV